MSSPWSRVGSLRATSRSVCEIASGVRSSWEALAANRCCSATWDFELFEHRVERVGELAELVLGAFHADPVGQRSVRGHPCRVGDPGERGEHPAGEDPSSQEAEHQQEGQRLGRAAGRRRAGGRSGWGCTGIEAARRAAPGR